MNTVTELAREASPGSSGMGGNRMGLKQEVTLAMDGVTTEGLEVA